MFTIKFKTLLHQTLCNIYVISSIKMGSIDLVKKNELVIKVWGRTRYGRRHTHSAKVTRL